MTVDLNNADLDTLNGLMERTPAPLQPLDAVMIDGYLAGVSVQPRIVPVTDWLPGVFDLEGRALPADHDPAWLGRCRALIERRFEVMNTDISEDSWFDPVIIDIDHAPPVSEYETPKTPAAQVLGPWLAGFLHALDRFPEVMARGDDEAAALVTQLVGLLSGEHATDVNRSVDALVRTVVALWMETEDQRYHVDTIRRSLPKVGRNEPCPCGSGRKYKACHGAPTS